MEKGELQDLESAILEYRKEDLTASDSSSKTAGIRHLIPAIRRHYYINLRTVADLETGEFVRGLWMYFPKSYAPEWPDIATMTRLINGYPENHERLPNDAKLQNINSAFRLSPPLHFRYDELKIIRYAIPRLSDFKYDADELRRSTAEYNKSLKDLFGPNGTRPPNYREFFYNFEKQTIFNDWDDNRCWVFFPIFFRHLWVSLLVAQIPRDSFDDVSARLPLVSGVIGEKLLTVRARLGWGHPITAVGSEEEVISLMSIVAAQCGLHRMSVANGIIEFSGDEQNVREVLQTVRVDNGWRQFSFRIATDDQPYFDAIWRECVPTLSRYQNNLDFRSNLARASIMSRNFSHNVGSHALANPSIYESLNLTPKHEESHTSVHETVTRLRTFHGYAQGRLDFMARAMTGSDERPEPLFFVGDVLNGFLRQGVLLNALLHDRGYAASELDFKIEISSEPSVQSQALFQWNEDELRFVATDSSSFEDVLVGIPGGKVACHAFYAFLENVLRNAAKYAINQSSTRRLEISFRLEKCKALPARPSSIAEMEEIDAWTLRITDNLSLDDGYNVSTRIRRYINSPLISDAHGTQFPVHGHGIQEMKVCAEILAGGAVGIRFPADGEHPGEQFDRECGTTHEYQEYLRQYIKPPSSQLGVPDNRPIRITSRQALRCYSNEYDGHKHLVYSILFPRPTLLGVVSIGPENHKGTLKFPVDSIKHFRNLEEMANDGSHLGLILDVGSESSDRDVMHVLGDIAVLHPALPFRLMVLTSRPETWNHHLTVKDGASFVRPPNSPFICGKHIPAQRVRVVDAKTEELAGCDLTDFPNSFHNLSSIRSFGANGWDAFVLWVYDLWIRAFKPLRDMTSPWKLCIGFDCDAQRVFGNGGFSVWKDRVKSWGEQEHGKTSVALLVKTRDGVRSTSANWPDVPVLDPKEVLVIDHHGTVLAEFKNSWLKKGPRFYQTVGLDVSLNLFQAIENPPASPFGFAFFILALTEAALTRVVVLDERVAQATIVLDRLLASTSANPEDGGSLVFQKAGIYPLYSFKRVDESWTLQQLEDDCRGDAPPMPMRHRCTPYGFLSRPIADAALKVSLSAAPGRDYSQVWDREGLVMGPGNCVVQSAYQVQDGAEVELIAADILLIHEGVTDVLHDSGRWSSADSCRLFECAPAIIRTSGRGQDSRHLPSFFPFVEFNEISGNIYASLNKLALVKSILGVKGKKIDTTETP